MASAAKENKTSTTDDKAPGATGDKAPERRPFELGEEFRVLMTRPKQVGETMFGAGECVGVISCHPQASPNYIVDGIRGGICTVVPMS